MSRLPGDLSRRAPSAIGQQTMSSGRMDPFAMIRS
jgi:hypothetical protein